MCRSDKIGLIAENTHVYIFLSVDDIEILFVFKIA